MASPVELKKATVVSSEDSHHAPHRKAVSLIKVLGIVTIVMGALPMLDYLLMIMYILRSISAKGNPHGRLSGLFIIIALSLVLPVAKVIGGYGLLKIRLWARKLAITVFTLEYLIACAGAALFANQCYRFRHMPPSMYHEAIAIGTLRMLPTYILALVSLLFIALLTRDSVTKTFPESDTQSP
jgi:hypothetical protein